MKKSDAGACFKQYDLAGRIAFLTFEIPLKPITKKNNGIPLKRKTKDGKEYITILPSAAFQRYQREVKDYIPRLLEPFDSPCNIEAVYTMPTRHVVDLTNLNSSLHDLLVKYGVLADDCYSIAYSTDGSHVEYIEGVAKTKVTIRRLCGNEFEATKTPPYKKRNQSRGSKNGQTGS